ncbi:MAG: retroviral-like aspartic protease family protein [Tannerellaceae bacterium]|jgi:aspartyl protease family protein|nr:retroviral-like aspartic protease family protein [Tannerellaceae bacterium]
MKRKKKYSWVLGCIILIIITQLMSISCVRRSHRLETKESSRSSRRENHNRSATRGKTVVKMEKKNGVYYVPCKINGSEMEFIFDTGASDITMSLAEVLFLFRQEKLSEDDFIGTQQYQIANGSIEEGSVVLLHTVEIGNRKLENVQASIVHNIEAPLLLGQSALAKFGKISIDYSQGEIIFE